jgi:hypothetical protein
VKLPYTNFIKLKIIRFQELNAIVHDVAEVYLWLNIKTDIHVENVDTPNLNIKTFQRKLIRNLRLELRNFLFHSLEYALLEG